MSLEGYATEAGTLNVLRGKIHSLAPNALDTTLTIEGAAAEAKATGDAIRKLESADASLETKLEASLAAATKGLATTIEETEAALNEAKVDKEEGKGLSSSDFTAEEKEKLASIEEGANNYALSAGSVTTEHFSEDAVAPAAEKLSTARKIGNASFDGSEDVTLSAIGAVGLNGSGKVAADQTSAAIHTKEGSCTLEITDAGALVAFINSAEATLTIPTAAFVAFPAGTEIEILSYGSGSVTIAGADGVILNSFEGKQSLAGTYATAVLKMMDYDEWLLTGALA